MRKRKQLRQYVITELGNKMERQIGYEVWYNIRDKLIDYTKYNFSIHFKYELETGKYD